MFYSYITSSYFAQYGKQLITQSIVGGYKQFLTKAQGMPERIEDALIKRTREFISEGSRLPRIPMDQLYCPIKEGGLSLLDIKARNQAIEIVWLKSYLNLSPTRPKWATVTDVILDAAAPPSTNTQARMNWFLQTWRIPTKGPRAEKMSLEIRRMINTASDFDANFTAIKLSPRLKGKLPAWLLTASDNTPINNRVAGCLLHKHKLMMIADLMMMSRRIRSDDETPPHRQSDYCRCTHCTEDNEKGCTHPHDCATEALKRLHLIAPK